jgi:hypothetical protein
MNESIVINHQEIAQLAYQYWERDGRTTGRDRDYWLEAEQQLKATKHLLLTEQRVTSAVAQQVKGNGKPSANGNAQPAAMKSSARKGPARPALTRSI